MDIPIKVAVQYSQKIPTIPHDNKAGAKDLAGFIDLPGINADIIAKFHDFMEYNDDG